MEQLRLALETMYPTVRSMTRSQYNDLVKAVVLISMSERAAGIVQGWRACLARQDALMENGAVPLAAMDGSEDELDNFAEEARQFLSMRLVPDRR